MFRASIVGLWFVSAGIAAISMFRNSSRAAECFGWISSSDQTGGGLFLFPLIFFALIADRTWGRKTVRISGAIVAIAFFLLVLYFTFESERIGYAPCDRKGDEHAQTVFLVEIIVIPLLWMTLAFLGVVGTSIVKMTKKVLIRVGLKKPNLQFDADGQDRGST
jgi:MFS family permease